MEAGLMKEVCIN